MPTAIIAEDEPALRKELERYLVEQWPELTIVASVANGRDAIAAIDTLDPDIAFLDIKMPEPDGMEVAREYGDRVAVVFVTAYSEFAVNAFEQEAVDYVLKPLSTERLEKTVDRLKEKLQQDNAARIDFESLSVLMRSKEKNYLTWLRVSERDQVKIINTQDVCFFHADAKYTSTFTSDREHLLRISISKLEQRLDPNQFWRIHRSTIVNVAAINSAKRDFRRRIRLKLTKRPEILRES